MFAARIAQQWLRAGVDPAQPIQQKQAADDSCCTLRGVEVGQGVDGCHQDLRAPNPHNDVPALRHGVAHLCTANMASNMVSQGSGARVRQLACCILAVNMNRLDVGRQQLQFT